MANLITTDNVYLTILDYDNQTVADQALIGGIIGAASIAIEKECKRSFLADDLVETRNGDSSEIIIARNPPINSIEKVVFKSSTDVEIDGANFLFEPEVGEIRWKLYNLIDRIDCYGYFPKGFRNIELHYNGGYIEVPSPIQQVCAQVAIQLFTREDADFQIIQNKIGNRYIKFDESKILFSHRRFLSLYKIRNCIDDPVDYYAY